jgi:uncharacterized membrane protein
MSFLLLVVGAIFGAILCGGILQNEAWGAGVVFGAISGLFIARWRILAARVSQLERDLVALRNARISKSMDSDKARFDATAQTVTLRDEPAADLDVPTAIPPANVSNNATAPIPARVYVPQAQPSVPADQPVDAMSASDAPAVLMPSQNANRITVPPAPRPVSRREPDSIERGLSAIKRWFTEGNVPVKIGVLVLFAGVVALIKYATDQGWLSLPIELRLAAIAAATLAALVFAWRKREQKRSFALSLQGGCIGILMMLVFSAFRVYHLIPSGAAFALLLILVVGISVLAVLQDAIALAVLGIIGGFLSPILVSTGGGSHVVLFSYYALLNTAILGIAWRKPWRVLNLIGFAFTFGIGSAWGVLSYQPQNLASTAPFLILFWLFYLVIPVLYALRQAPDRRDFIDATLVFGTPLIAFPLLAGLLHGDRLTLAFSAVLAAAVYTTLAWVLLRRFSLKLLGESHALLALGFATLAVPLALSARTTACAWALEGAALVWLGLRQERRLPRWIGYALQLAAAFSLAVHFNPEHIPVRETQVIFNGTFFCALLISLAGFVSARLLSLRDSKAPLSHAMFWWALGWWYLLGGNEIQTFAAESLKTLWAFGFVSISAWIGAELLRRLRWQDCALPAVIIFPLALPMIGIIAFEQHGPLEGYAIPVWAIWLLAALRSLHNLQPALSKGMSVLQFIFLWALVLLLGTEFGHLADVHFSLAPIWVVLAGLLPFATLFWLTLERKSLVHYPLPALGDSLRTALLATLGIVLGLFLLLGLFVEGHATPLPYVPLLNPLELAQCLVALLMLRWYRSTDHNSGSAISQEAGLRVFALFGFALLTSITLRSVHFLANLPWNEHLFDATVTQASLSLVWSAVGIAAMLFGAKRKIRGAWIGGAALMGVVLVKLILIDRQHLGDLPGILSFLAVGVLLLVVGYFAPVPPRKLTTINGDSE